jgi:hypothetical protein
MIPPIDEPPPWKQRLQKCCSANPILGSTCAVTPAEGVAKTGLLVVIVCAGQVVDIICRRPAPDDDDPDDDDDNPCNDVFHEGMKKCSGFPYYSEDEAIDNELHNDVVIRHDISNIEKIHPDSPEESPCGKYPGQHHNVYTRGGYGLSISCCPCCDARASAIVGRAVTKFKCKVHTMDGR